MTTLILLQTERNTDDTANTPPDKGVRKEKNGSKKDANEKGFSEKNTNEKAAN